MKLFKSIIQPLMLLSATFFILIACEEDPKSIYDPDAIGNPDPIIATVVPDSNFSSGNIVFAGIGVVRITGENFSATREYNSVFFDGVLGTILSASTTSLRVQVPNVTGDSVQVRITVRDAYYFGDYSSPLPVVSAVKEVGGFIDSDSYISTVSCDNSGNTYVNGDKNIYIIKPDSVKSEYNSTILTGIGKMKMGPAGNHYFIIATAISRITPPDVTEGLWFKAMPEALLDFDFNVTGSILLAGVSGVIYSFDIDTKTFTEDSTYHGINVRSMRVFDGDLYVSGERLDTLGAIVQKGLWSSEIVGESLSGMELLADLGDIDANGDLTITSMAISASGSIFLGNLNDPPLIRYKNGQLSPFHEPILSSPIGALSWGSGDYLYLVRQARGDVTQRVLELDMGQAGAVYYGRD
ncbi:MAG: IPT/TIG domain-containing protein [Candidatus Marinimicrobia bacterium]|nr:IPT/TIG domain-containing protein [Candidatus Neomarinimicrobiota bacterium]MBT4713359.1 IPT/TIG domain-containing protein [Candidatus Neomarinimicrobiota bacterium]MBT4944999.1 IPT/TIG domain-containing protein [Candidatus Neomarinimicrobiota bacterium]MBT5271414.1 IPT/TIG domain-containing protein [Candidatus Neomarinimicrobiota bacterium]MBT6012405.1 IPT/TIG domain-containing protein [Candidatus Neomarinimicrobiota bacterium]